MKKLICISVICLSLLSGCALHRKLFYSQAEMNEYNAKEQAKKESNRRNNFTNVARIGVQLRDRNGEIYVSEIVPDKPAYSAGIKPGDTIVTLDGRKILRIAEFRGHLNNKVIGERVLISVRRNGQILSFDIDPTFTKVPPTLIKLDSLLVENKKITIAIIVSDVKNATLDKSSGTYDAWVDSIRSGMQSNIESNLLNAFGNDKSFSIVDRNRLKQILDEYRLSQVGLISDKLRVQIGEMTGATHLLDATLSRFSHDRGYEDVESKRLIDIETGNVLAVDTENREK